MTMLYLSVQPAEYYFLWQLEIQLYNFKEIGISPDNIQVILGYKVEEGIPDMFRKLEDQHLAQFYYYQDTRENSKYTSSIRPHLLQKHFTAYPELSRRTIFYHDSDIIFRERIDEERFKENDIWYLSDTINYLSANYLKGFGITLFEEMCAVAEIDPMVVEQNVLHSGGAQHIMKGLTADYWAQVETDSELIYDFLSRHNASRKDGKKVQSWCADMWAVLWGAWKRGVQTQVHAELDFCWPKDHITRWYDTKILHNAGVFQKDKQEYFCKLLYKRSSPYYVDFTHLKKDTCSEVFVSKIGALESLQEKAVLADLTVIIWVKDANSHIQGIVLSYVRYLRKHFTCAILVAEQGDLPRIDKDKLPSDIMYNFIGESDVSSVVQKLINTKYFLYNDARILLPVDNIKKSYFQCLDSYSRRRVIIPYNEIKSANTFFQQEFQELLNAQYKRIDALSRSAAISTAECFLTDKKTYMDSGGEHRYLHHYARDGFNMEREVRYRILGNAMSYIPEKAVKLFEVDDKQISKAQNKEFLAYCNLSADNLRRFIAQGLFTIQKDYKKITGSLQYPLDVYCINLKKRKDRRQHSLLEFQDKPEFAFHLFDAIEHRTGNIGLWQSFVSILRKAKENNLLQVVVCEDDIQFANPYSNDILRGALQKMTKYGLQLIIGGSTGGHQRFYPLDSNLVWVDRYWSNHFLIIHNSCFDDIIGYDYRNEKAVDLTLSEIIKHKAVMVPFIATQKDFGYSDVTLNNHINPADVQRRFIRNEAKLLFAARVSSL